eukprot:m.198446 g.198446  ORF g.198446 m.198446 type:complete len:502 (+) comp39560_c0_seq1:23-1528(+)
MADDDNSVDRSEGTTPRASSRMTLKDATSKVKQEALRSLQLGDRTETETPSENPEEPMKEKESNDEEPPKAQPTATLAPASHEVDNEESVAPESSSEGERPTSGESRGVAGKRGVVEDKEEETDDGRSSEATDLADNGGRASEASSHVPTVAVPVGVGDDDDGSYGGDYSDSSLDVQPTGRKKPKRRPAVRRVFDSMDESDTGREGGRRKRDGDKSVSLVREEGDERVESRKKPRGKTRGGKRDVDVEEDEEESQEGDDEDGEGSTEKITESSPPVVTDTVEEVDTGKREESVSKDEEGDEEEEEDEDLEDEIEKVKVEESAYKKKPKSNESASSLSKTNPFKMSQSGSASAGGVLGNIDELSAGIEKKKKPAAEKPTAGEKKPRKRESQKKKNERLGLKAWMEENKEMLEGKYPDLPDDEWFSQCSAEFLKLEEEDRGSWIQKGKDLDAREKKGKGKKKKMADENAKPSAGQKTLSFFACNEKKKVSDKLAGFTFSKQTD